MVLEGKLFVSNRMTDVVEIKHSNPAVGFSKELEECLILVCKKLNVPVPMWMNKNTHEFAAFRQTIFFAEQYTEDVKFDRFQIRLIEADI